MVKIALVGIITVLLAVQLKKTKEEFSIYIAFAGSLIIFYMGIQKLGDIIETINKIQSYININSSYVGILIKMIGIAYIAEFSSNLCKDAGHTSVSNQIELVGKLSILVISMPVLMALLESINQFLK